MPLPPGPTLPRAIQTLMLATRPFELLDGCARRYGSPFTLQLVGLGEWVIVSRPDDFRAMCTADPEVARGGEINKRFFGTIVGERALIVMEGEAHLRRRRMIMKAFGGEEMRRYTLAMREIVEDELRSWPEGEPFTLLPRLQRLSAQVILRIVFGLRGQDERTRRLSTLLLRLSDVATKSPLMLIPALQIDLGPRSPWGRVVALLREADAALFEEIQRRRATPPASQPRDVLTMLLSVVDDEGRALSDRDLRDELIELLLGGSENTAIGAAWAFEQILGAPEVLARLREELSTASSQRGTGGDSTNGLDYLDAALKESLRVRPPLYVAGARRLRGSVEIGAHAAPPGATLVCCSYLLHRRPEVYPEPDRFLPDRFLGQKPDPYRWAPFGGGPRRCPGMFFAMHEMKVVLSTVLAKTELRLATRRSRIRGKGLQLVPDDGVRVIRQAAAR